MLSRTLNQIAQSPWARLIWAGVAVLVLVQMVAFYKLCAGQVERAHARETIAVQQRDALTDCLDYVSRSTISSCARKATGGNDNESASLAARDMPTVRSQARKQAVFSSAVPVSYVYH